METLECSNCSLILMFIAWMGGTLIASVLLRWKYMWIGLIVLCILFLLVYGYISLNDYLHGGRQLNRQPEVYDNMNCSDNCLEAVYENPTHVYWIPDSPPPYAAVVGAEPSRPTTASNEEILQRSESILSNPPPYSLAIQSDHTIIYPAMSQTLINQQYSPDEPVIIVPNNLPTISSELTPQTVSNQNQNQNKNTVRESANSEQINSSRSDYLSNLMCNTFRRDSRTHLDRIDREESTPRCILCQERSSHVCRRHSNYY